MNKEELFKDFRLWVGYLLSFCDYNELKKTHDNPSSIYDMKYTFIKNYGRKYNRTFVNEYKDELFKIIEDELGKFYEEK